MFVSAQPLPKLLQNHVPTPKEQWQSCEEIIK